MTKLKRNRHALRRRKRIQLEALESRVLLAADWQNPINQYDVNGSDEAEAVSPLDALLIINELTIPTVSDPISGQLPLLDEGEVSAYFDVSGDGYVSPIDALAVINELSDLETVIPSGSPFPSITDRTIAGSRAALSHGVEHDTLVNNEVDHKQSLPDIAAGPGGEVVIVWQSLLQDGSSWGVFAQRYDSSGLKVGDEIPVNTTTKRSQRDAAVAVADDGSFVVVWNSRGQDGAGWGVFGQQFDSDGMRVGDEFQVNETTKGSQNHADITMLDGGDFVVTWEGRGVGDYNGIFMRRFSAGGNSDEMRVNQTSSGDQSRPTVAAIPGGDFVIAWQGKGNGDSYGIFMRRFSAAGDSTDGDSTDGGSTDGGSTDGGSADGDSDEVRVNDDKRGYQALPDVDVGPDGQFVIAWKEGDGRSVGVSAKQFAADGTAGSQFQVNQTINGIQKAPAVAYLSDGRFSVSWFGRGDGDNRGTFTRTFNADGTAESDEALVNTTVRCGQVRPAAAAVGGGYVVAWQGRGIGDRSGVFARFYSTESVVPFRLDPLGNQTVSEGDTVSFTANVVDLDGTVDNVTFSLGGNAPAAALIDASTGEFTWVTTEADDGEFPVDVIATDGDFSVTQTVDIRVSKVNDAPVLGNIDDVSVGVDSPVSVTLTATDADLPSDSHSFAVTQSDGADLPAWLSFDADTMVLSGTPAESDVGISTLLATVTDADGLADSQTFTVSVVSESDPFSIVSVEDQVVNEGEELVFTVTANDTGENDTVGLTTSTLPDGASVDLARPSESGDDDQGTFRWTPAEDQGPGTETITFTASNGEFSTSLDIVITINEVNQDPVMAAIDDQSLSVGEVLSLAIVATDPDLPANSLMYFADLGDSSFLSFDPVTRILSGTPGDTDVGSSQVTVTVDDGEGGADSETFIVEVVAEPFDVLLTGQTTVDEGTAISVTATVEDLDGVADNVVWSAADVPAGATFETATGVFTWTPTEADGPGTFRIPVTATDGAFSVTKSIEITVNEVASAPVLAEIADQTVAVGESLSVGIVAIDPDFPVDDLTYSVALADGGDLPAWLSFNPATQILAGTPSAVDAGTVSLRVGVSDPGGLRDEQLLNVTVSHSTTPMVVTPIADQTIREGDAFSLDVTTAFDDADGDALTYSAESSTEIPAWLSFADGVFGGTPPAGSVGATEISVTAMDPDGNNVADTFVLTVGQNVNSVPRSAAEQVFRVDASSAAGTDVGTVVSSDADGDALSYSIVSGNDGGAFAIDANTGAITIGSAGVLENGNVESLTVQASDGTATVDTTATIYVTSAPVAVQYSLQAFDSDGNAITSVSPGQDIELRLFVQDIRDAARGVFSAYADIAYGVTTASPNGASPIAHSSTYNAGVSGVLAAGLIDELGGTDGISDLGSDKFEVARVAFTIANDANGVVHFAINVAEDTIQHPTLLFGGASLIPAERIEFGSLTLDVVGGNG